MRTMRGTEEIPGCTSTAEKERESVRAKTPGTPRSVIRKVLGEGFLYV